MLINCVVYRDGNKLADIPVAEISDYLKRPDCFIWVALFDATDAELDTLQHQFGLPHLAVEDARHRHQRPKIEEYRESLFVAMHLLEAGEKEVLAGELHVFTGPNFVLSIRHRSQQGFHDVRERCEREPALLKLGAGFVLYALMDAVVDRYFPVLEDFETKFEDIEEQIFEKGAAANNIKRLYALKRRLVVIKHAVVSLMEAAGKLYGGRVPSICANTQDYFRDIEDHLSRMNSAVDALRDGINTAILVCQSTVGIEQNEVSKQLAAWAAIFAVTTAFAGIWGMNFEIMPELRWALGYPAALLLMAAVAGYLYLRFRRSGWL